MDSVTAWANDKKKRRSVDRRFVFGRGQDKKSLGRSGLYSRSLIGMTFKPRGPV